MSLLARLLLLRTDVILNLITIALITSLLILSLAFIFHLRFKTSRCGSSSAPHLRDFNSLWALRLLLVLSTILWALSHLLLRLRLNLLNNINPFLLCRLHVLLTLGLSQPTFLLTLLALVHLSINNNTRHSSPLALLHVTLLSLLLLVLQALTLFGPTNNLLTLHKEDPQAICTYPLLNIIVFAVFAFSFLIGFVLSCWRVVSVVINKRLRMRIYALGATETASVVLQVAFMALSVFWLPESVAALLVFLAGMACAFVGEGVLVISPIADTLNAGG